jgi:hypothetical protein
MEFIIPEKPPWQWPSFAKKGNLTIIQIPLGDVTSIILSKLITAPAGINIRSTVPGNCGHGLLALATAVGLFALLQPDIIYTSIIFTMIHNMHSLYYLLT